MRKIKLLYKVITIVMIMITTSCGHESGRLDKTGTLNKPTNSRPQNIDRQSSGKTVIRMIERGGVYIIPCRVNGHNMEFIFDTGASDITISLTEALFLYKQGSLTDDDFLGTQHYQIANGDIEEGTVINLKEVQIGNKTIYDVKASVVHNLDAPLLLGQSVLNRFGKISIDYLKKEIVFE